MYTTAIEIENYASEFGYEVVRDNKGHRHPGTVCNTCLKAILADSATKRALKLSSDDYPQVDRHISPNNKAFQEWLVDEAIINPTSVKLGKLDLYSIKSAEAILSSLLRYPYSVPTKDIRYIEIQIPIVTTSKLFAKKEGMHKPLKVERKVEEFDNSDCNGIDSVISMLTIEEQIAVRKYRRLLTETRNSGRPYIKKGGKK